MVFSGAPMLVVTCHSENWRPFLVLASHQPFQWTDRGTQASSHRNTPAYLNHSKNKHLPVLRSNCCISVGV